MSQQDPAIQGAQPKKKGGCMGCSWACIIPAGCLGILFLGCIGTLTFMFGIPYYKITHASVYSDAIAKAKESTAVKQVLGDPVTEGYPSALNYAYKNGITS